MKGDLINTDDEKSVILSLQSPIKVAHAQVSLLLKPNEYVALVKTQWGEDQYYGRAGFTIQGNNKRSVYKPVVEFQVPKQDKKAFNIDGQIVKEVNGVNTKYTLEGIKINMPSSNDIVDINGFYSNDKKTHKVELKANKGEHNGVFKGSLVGLDYNAEFTNTLNPNVNFRLKGKSDNDIKKKHVSF